MMYSATTCAHRGLGLLDLLAVILIVGVLAAVALPRLVDLGAGASQASRAQVIAQLRNTADMLILKWRARGEPDTLVLEGGTTVRFINGAPSAVSLMDYPGWRPPGFFMLGVHGHAPDGYLIHCDLRMQAPCGMPGTRCSFTYFNAQLPDSRYRLDTAALADPTCD